MAYTDNRTRDFETEETDRLIASDKIEGTAVYDRAGERLGDVYPSCSAAAARRSIQARRLGLNPLAQP